MAASMDGTGVHPASASVAPMIAAAPGRLWVEVDRFLAPQAESLNADERRRARLTVAVSASIVALGVPIACNLMLHGVWGNLPVTLGLLVVVSAVPFVLRRTGSLVLAGNAIAGVLAATLAILKFNSGTIAVPPFIFLPGVPLIAALIAGPRAGVFWGGFAIVELGFFYFLAINGLEPMIELNPEHLFRGRYVGAAVMVGFVLLLAQAYERLKTRALDELRQAQRLAEERSRELEESRRQQLEMKDRFVSHVSHELRTPLTALHQFLSIVLDGLAGKIEGEQREYLAIAFRNAEQLRRMIDDLMDLNRARSGKLRVESDLFPVGPVLADCVRNLEARAGEKGIRLQACASEELAVAQADPTRVRQVVGNLVENAIKFTPKDGRVDVTGARDPDDDSFLRISVRDTGCGIEPGAVDRIFDRLHQEQSAETDSRLGLGLGLAIARELVERQGGHIWAESQPGSGSTFHFTLPIFELARALRPCVLEEGELRRNFSVLHVELLRGSAIASEGLQRGVLHLLRTSVFYPERDVVLPKGALGDAPGRFAVVAATGAEGAEALAKRLALRLDRFAEASKTCHAEFRVRAHTEEVPAELDRCTRAEALEILAGRVEEILREAGHERGET